MIENENTSMRATVKDVKKFTSTDGSVSKYVFESNNRHGIPALYEAVLYTHGDYKERTVICCSVQSGCPVGCTFCGTGKAFIRNLEYEEIVNQIRHIVCDEMMCTPKIRKFQIMFMSCGEPFLNYRNLEDAIIALNCLYPTAQLLVSTSAPISTFYDRFIDLSKRFPQIGLQFSIHATTDAERNKIIPFVRKFSLEGIAQEGKRWALQTKRKPFINYCVHEGNSTRGHAEALKALFDPDVFELTLSVICEKDQTMAQAREDNLKPVIAFMEHVQEMGFHARVFNPSGQDDIGGGCGQLWFFQQWLKEHAA